MINRTTILSNMYKNRFKNRHYNQTTLNTLNKANLIQLLFFIKPELLEYRNNSYYLADNPKVKLYNNMAYNFYSGDCFSVLNVLQYFLELTFPQATYITNYFYYKVPKKPIEAKLYKMTKHSAIGTTFTKEDVDLQYILSEDKLKREETKSIAYNRLIAYLCNTRKIDKDIVLNLTKQGFVKMDSSNNICFITYRDIKIKDEIIAITKKGTLPDSPFKGNQIKVRNTGFIYSQKGDIERSQFKQVFVFESILDLLSMLTLKKLGKVEFEEDDDCIYISLNGLTKKYLYGILEAYPTIKSVNLCLDNDMVGIGEAQKIENDIKANWEAVDIIDHQAILRDLSLKYAYCKDWNESLKIEDDFFFCL